MKKNALISILFYLLIGLSFTACTSRTTTDPQAPPPASPGAPDTAVATNSTTAVQIESTSFIEKGLQDAIKDFPMVHASVDSGVVTLTGEVRKDQLQDLMMSVHLLHPKAIRNDLVLK